MITKIIILLFDGITKTTAEERKYFNSNRLFIYIRLYINVDEKGMNSENKFSVI